MNENSMDRTLYLTEKRGLLIKRDGPSIWIKEKGKSGRRIPARLINMVFVVGNIKIDSGVITLFTENNTPVTFMNNKGEMLGVAMPNKKNHSFYAERQKLLCSTTDLIEEYTVWLKSMKKRLQLNALKQMAYPVAVVYMNKGFRERDYNCIIDTMKKDKESQWDATRRIVINIIEEMIIDALISIGLDPHEGVVNVASNFSFAKDICDAMAPVADLQSFRFLKSARPYHFIVDTENNCVLSRDGLKKVIFEFENCKYEFKSSIIMIINSFLDFLRGV